MVAPRGYLYQGTGNLSSIGVDVAAGTHPNGAAVDPTGRFLYVANNGDNTVQQYTINQLTGIVTSIGTIAAGGGTWNVVVDPTGRYVYSVNTGSVSQYSINQSTGALSSLGADVTVGVGTGTAIAVDPTGRFLYVGGNSAAVVLLTINQSNGTLTAGSSYNIISTPYSMVVDPTGRWFYVNTGLSGKTISQFSINQTTGALTSIGPDVATGLLPTTIVVDPAGIYAYSINYFTTINIYSINQNTGALTEITGSPISVSNNQQSAVIDPTGKYLYIANYTQSTVSQYKINQTTGLLTLVTADISSGLNPDFIVVESSGRFIYTTNYTGNSVSQYVINNVSFGNVNFSTVNDSYGSVRSIPWSGGADKTSNYTLAATDNGQFISLGGGGSITIPASVFTAGAVITIYNNTSSGITITCSAVTTYIAGVNLVKTSLLLATRGVVTVLYTSATSVVVSGSVS